ncbi:hypothetical protein OXB_2814 [Bacillus sp. OxB-1]|uniref:hypothetical protein n=1 Tax=Bacillus sp. (strain OxB-1) TaxID=98228 RepID=UPI000581DD83|nr:hypothetical protein [Bacillus sp. OxB-1]BAQ11285.1 hypothetical protein OXB_2814 [Bacillus sp. OxB-1]
MPENANELVKELTKVMTDIGLDIREIKTTLTHFGEKFDRVQNDIAEVKIATTETEHEVEALKIKMNTVEIQSADTKHDVGILFQKFRERDKKSDTDRKWLIGTVLTVVGLTITYITFIINYLA